MRLLSTRYNPTLPDLPGNTVSSVARIHRVPFVSVINDIEQQNNHTYSIFAHYNVKKSVEFFHFLLTIRELPLDFQ